MTKVSTIGKTVSDKSARFSGRGWMVLLLLGVGLIVAIPASLCIGAYPMSFSEAARIASHLAWPGSLPDHSVLSVKELVVVQVVRLPRVLLATLVGLGLGISGTALQGIIRNPLVGPDVVGVSSGAAFGGVLAMLWDFPPLGVVLLACCGGMLALACTFGLAKLARAGSGSMVLVLAGIFIGAVFLALAELVKSQADDAHLPAIFFWLLGTFNGADARKVMIVGIPTLLCGAVMMMFRWRLNLLSLGDLDARTLGINVTALRWFVIGLVSMIVASQVAVSGVVGWIGLVVPHFARMLVGPDHRKLLPAAALLGALFVLGLDDFTRAVMKEEIPAGVLSAVVGTPAVCYLLWKSKGKGWGRE
jgi:iron complex transport system permease protein